LGASPDLTERWFAAPRGISALWAGILAGPCAWAADLGISYSLVQWTCGGGPQVVLHLITLFSLSIIGGGAFAAWRALQLVSFQTAEDGNAPDERGKFMAMLGLAMCIFFAIVVVASAIPRWVLDACHQ
jgi:hypothetical protein